ncbi:MAG: S-adenosylmethionine:tRNA ribosyltransferase-isomerase, partial [Bacteroidota bacterium]|nr:S-adenosylmethionine:tRNA ribosyltransferase-isomerase [Bacteroidota bacterium]
MKREELLIKEFSYYLPEDKIALHPLAQRDESKLLIYKESRIEQSKYKYLAQFLPQNSFLVFNNTKVIGARLLFTKASGGTIEVFCLAPPDEYKDVSTALLQ